MFKHYLVLALTNCARHRVTAAVNILVLTLGFTCFIGARNVVDYYPLNDRQLPGSERVYFVASTTTLDRQSGAKVTMPTASPELAEYLRAQFPELETITWISNGNIRKSLAVDDRTLAARIRGADREFLRLFPLRYVEGDRDTVLSRPQGAVISESAAVRLFGTSQVLGRSVLVEGSDSITIDAVVAFPDIPSHLGDDQNSGRVSFDLLLYKSSTAQGSASSFQNLFGFGTLVYLQLPANGKLDAAAIEKRMAEWSRINVPAPFARTFALRPLSSYRELQLDDRVGRDSIGWSWSVLLMSAVGLVLLIACLNYSNLAAAVAASHVKESSIRRVLGASARQIAVQYFIETFLLTLVSALLALSAIALLAPIARRVFDIDLLYVWSHSPRFWLATAIAVAAVSLFSSVLPIVIATSARLANALVQVRGGHRYAAGTRWFVGVQFALISVLIVWTLVVRVQQHEMLEHARNSLPGPMIVINDDLPTTGMNFDTLRTELLREPHIRSVTNVRFSPWDLNMVVVKVAGSPDTASTLAPVINNGIDRDFFSSLDFHVLAGQLFDRDASVAEESAPSGVVIDQTAASLFGWHPQQAVGKMLYTSSGPGKPLVPTSRIIGVVEDNTTQFTSRGVNANIYRLSATRLPVPLVGVAQGHAAEALAEIQSVWHRLAPNSALRTQFMDDLIEKSARQVNPYADAVGWVALCALAIALSGLVGMSVHIANRRTHEIGVRKTLGASTGQVVLLLLRASLWPVLLGNLLGWPIAYLLSRTYLNVYTHRIALTPTLFVASAVIALVVATLAIGGHSLRAARLKPADVLRHE